MNSMWRSSLVFNEPNRTIYCRILLYNVLIHHSSAAESHIQEDEKGPETAGAFGIQVPKLNESFQKKSVRQYNLHSPWMARSIIWIPHLTFSDPLAEEEVLLRSLVWSWWWFY
jgi:hypothetical protein